MKLILIVFMLLCSVSSAQNWTAISASNITDATGKKLAAGQICIFGTGQNNAPINFGIGGGDQLLKGAVCSVVTNGTIASGFHVPNSAKTSPKGDINATGSLSASTLSAQTLAQVRIADQWCSTTGTLDQTCLINAAISSGAKIVDLPTGTYTISANVTFPSRITYRFEPGAILSVPLGIKATFAGPIVAGNQQIFRLVAPVKVTDAAMASGASTVTSASGQFTPAMVGAPITVFGCSATAVGGVHEACHGTITAYTSATSVTASFTNRSGAYISAKTAYFGGSYVDFAPTADAIGRIDVRWWGATGDGATDDTDAIQEAMTAGEECGLPVYAPTGSYLVGNIQLGDPSTQNDWGASNVQYGLPGISAMFGDGWMQTVFKAKSGTTGYVLTRQSRPNVTYRDFGIDGNATAGGCFDDAWTGPGNAGPAPSAEQAVEDIHCTGFTGIGAYGIWADNQNDSKFDGIDVAGPGGAAYGLYADAPTGWFNLVNSRFIGDKVAISAQNATFAHDLFFGGFESIGQGRNTYDFSGVQFGPAADTGIDFDSTNTGFAGTDTFHCSGCWFVAGNGQSVLAGKFYLGGSIDHSSFTLSGTGTVFGSITTCCAPYLPTFTLTEDMGIPSRLSAPSNAHLITGLNDNAGTGTISSMFWSDAPYVFDGANASFDGIVSAGNDGKNAGYGFFCGGGTCDTSSHYLIGGNGRTAYMGAGYSAIHTRATLDIDHGAALTGTLRGGTVNPSTLKQDGQSIVVRGKDGLSSGQISISSATSNFHTFRNAYTVAPICTATPAGSTPAATALSYAVSSSTTAITVTLSAPGTATFNFLCSPAAN